jgi:hypothetical protein
LDNSTRFNYKLALKATQERISPALSTDGRLRAMTGVNGGAVRQYHQLGMNTINQLAVAATGKVRPADAIVKKGIPAKDNAVP